MFLFFTLTVGSPAFYIGALNGQKGTLEGSGEYLYTTYPETLQGSFMVYLYINLYWGMLYIEWVL